MNLKDAFIHRFKTLDNYYIYDVNYNAIVKIPQDVYEYLGSREENKMVSKETADRINNMINIGLLSNKRIPKIEHSFTELLPFYLKNRMTVITLQVTQQCNLRCAYCAYSGDYEHRTHCEKNMSFETAKKSIDYMISNSCESNSLNIGFYGGEPLLRFDFIKECVKYAKEQAEGKKLDFHMTTNGTIMNDKIMGFLAENNFSLLISLDGPEEIHNKNRRFASSGKGSFKVIMNNISKFKEKYPEYVKQKVHFNAVLDGTVDFKCTKSFFNSYEDVKDFKVNITSISGEYSKKDREVKEDFVVQLNYERFKVMLKKVGKLEEKYVSKLFINEFERLKDRYYNMKHQNGIGEKDHPSGPCIPGVRKCFVSVDGNYYPCERVCELSDVMKIGNVNEGLKLDKINPILNIGKVSERECKNCWAYRFCYLCAAHCDGIGELSREKKIRNCGNVKFNIEENLKDFCTLMEFGYDFEESEINYLSV